MSINVAILGAGRMGCELVRALRTEPGDLRLAAVWARSTRELERQQLAEGLADTGVTVTSELSAALGESDVAIDFTLPEATLAVAAAARRRRRPLVCGVSGIGKEGMDALRAAAGDVPVFFERNMSIGIALLRESVARASAVLGAGFDIDISDLHHAAKRDAPSGTALLLGEAAAAARGEQLADVMHYAPAGDRQRRPGDIGFTARREGTHPGQHEVLFSGEQESLAFRHTVTSRRVFADGALRAAHWLTGRPAGYYGMQDLLDDLCAP